MQIAIVTGASSGLGREFVRQIAAKRNLDAIWVIARREERLLEMAKTLPVPLVPFAMDLTRGESFLALQAHLAEEKPDLRILVNAAGFGKMGNYAEISPQDSNDMIALNCRALMRMTTLALPYMRK